MGLFDRLRNFADRVLNRAPKPVEPPIDSQISQAWQQAAPERKPSFLERVKEGARNLFNLPKRDKTPPKAPEAPAPAPTPTSTPTPQTPTPKHFKPLDEESRKDEIFKFRRNVQEEGNAFYRLTQSIWDDPSIPASKRDDAIRAYFADKYGLTDMNDIYDFVLEQNKELIEQYRNAPNALKYEVLKNIKVNGVEL